MFVKSVYFVAILGFLLKQLIAFSTLSKKLFTGFMAGASNFLMNLILYMAAQISEIVNMIAVRILLLPIISPSLEELELVKIEKVTITTPIVKLTSQNTRIWTYRSQVL